MARSPVAVVRATQTAVRFVLIGALITLLSGFGAMVFAVASCSAELEDASFGEIEAALEGAADRIRIDAFESPISVGHYFEQIKVKSVACTDINNSRVRGKITTPAAKSRRFKP